MKDVIDEVLNGEPLYDVIDSTTGEVIYKGVGIILGENIEVLQKGTPINKALFDSIQGDLYRVDKYTVPKYVEGIKNTYKKCKSIQTIIRLMTY